MRSKLLASVSAFALAATVSACDDARAPTEPIGKPSLDQVANEWVPILLVFPNPCNELDIVTLEGKLHVTANAEVDPLDPDVRARLHINSAALKGEGTSGSKYQAKIQNPNTQLVADLDPLGNPRIRAKDRTVIRLVSTEPGQNDLIVSGRFYVTEDGIKFLDVEAECGPIETP